MTVLRGRLIPFADRLPVQKRFHLPAGFVGVMLVLSVQGCGANTDTPIQAILATEDADATAQLPDVLDDASSATDAVAIDADDAGDDAATPGDEIDVPPDSGLDAPVADAAAVSCTSDASCANGTVCDPWTQKCSKCVVNWQCPVGNVCVEKSCIAMETCALDADCAGVTATGGVPLPICATATQLCIECAATVDCGANQTCNGGKCELVLICKSTNQCPGNLICDPILGKCAECGAASDCKPGETCDGGKCKAFTACSSDKDCKPIGLVCDKAKGVCADCVTDFDCPEIYHCGGSGVGGTGACVPDLCKAQEAQCQGNALAICNDSGSGFTKSTPCGAQTTCVHNIAGASCSPWTCQPGIHCDGAELVTCGASGLNVLAKVDCAAQGATCLGDACVPLVCTPSALFCDGQLAKVCSADGTVAYDAGVCTEGTYCSDGDCLPQVCQPNTPACIGTQVANCNAVGSALVLWEDCSPTGQVCSDGVCAKPICLASDVTCTGNDVMVCSANGMAWGVAQTCNTASHCIGGVCLANVCAPNTALCDGFMVTQCNAVGSGFTNGTDCSLTGLTCDGGACAPIVCTANALFCDSNAVKKCSATGAAWSLVQTCDASSVCENGVCKPMACSPGLPSCIGSVAGKCNAAGTALNPGAIDCSDGGDTCVAGACKALFCTPNTSVCDGAGTKSCNATGTGYLPIVACGPGKGCISGICEAAVCVPNAPTCNDNVATVCKLDGSGIVSNGGTDCAAIGKACVVGICEAKVCTPNALSCVGPSIYLCNATGTELTVQSKCGIGTNCDGGTCQPAICWPGVKSCSGAVLETCNTEGTALIAGKTCTTPGGCANGVCVATSVSGDSDGDGYTTTAGASADCNDANAFVHPGQTEVCNGLDDNCDGTTDPAGADGCIKSYADNDGDHYGDPTTLTCTCAAPTAGRVLLAGDCSDTNATLHPQLAEVCDGIDNDCDGITDPDGSKGCSPLYRDVDGDGYGVMNWARCSCAPSAGWSTLATDCDDNPVSGAKSYPGNKEVCDGVDNDCDGVVDPISSLGCIAYYADNDHDGFGASGAQPECLCAALLTLSATAAGDCNDTNPLIRPGVGDTCNGIDDNCNGATDENGTAGCGVGATCAAGKCSTGFCPAGFLDLNGKTSDGCECAILPAPGGAGDKCSAAVDLGSIAEFAAPKAAVGTDPQAGNGAWYHVHAIDTADTDKTGDCDRFNFQAFFITNPQAAFVFDVYRGSCASASLLCSGVTDHSWATDFYGSVPSGPDALKNPSPGGITSVSPLPELGGECNCIANGSGLPGMNICTDNSADFYIHVYRTVGPAVDCQPYVLSVRNGKTP